MIKRRTGGAFPIKSKLKLKTKEKQSAKKSLFSTEEEVKSGSQPTNQLTDDHLLLLKTEAHR
jgi:hypothetical protein